MPSFSENFERTERNEVQFDDNAVYPVIASCITFIFLVLVHSLCKSLTSKLKYSNESVYFNCKCQVCKQKLQRLKERSQITKRSLSLYVFAIIGLIISFGICYYKIKSTQSQVKTFNPYDILHTPTNSDLKEIKKAYKTLALKYHPDKNLNNLQAKAQFILVTKAYNALTDETSKKNYDLYGNPDGPSSMRVSVGLPSFILNKRNHLKILILFLILIIGIIPYYFFKWFKQTQLTDTNGILNSTNEKFVKLTDDKSMIYHIPFYLGLADEFKSFAVSKDEIDAINKAFSLFTQSMPIYNKEELLIGEKKAIAISFCYAYQFPIQLSHLEEYIYVLAKLIDQFFLCQLQKYNLFTYNQQQEYINEDIKPVQPEFIKHIFIYQQSFFQAISIRALGNCHHPYIQLPCFTPNHVIGREDDKSILAFSDYMHKSLSEKTEYLSSVFIFNKDQVNEICIATRSIPLYEYQLSYFIDGFEDFVLGDLVTYQLDINRINLDEEDKDKEIGIGHSANYPGIFNDCIQITIVNGGRLIHQEKILVNKKKSTFDFKLKLGSVGNLPIIFELVPTCYLGLDQVIHSNINVIQYSQKRRETIKQIEKRKVKLELSVFQNILKDAGMFQDNESDEDEDNSNNDKQRNSPKHSPLMNKDDNNHDPDTTETTPNLEHEKNE